MGCASPFVSAARAGGSTPFRVARTGPWSAAPAAADSFNSARAAARRLRRAPARVRATVGARRIRLGAGDRHRVRVLGGDPCTRCPARLRHLSDGRAGSPSRPLAVRDPDARGVRPLRQVCLPTLRRLALRTVRGAAGGAVERPDVHRRPGGHPGGAAPLARPGLALLRRRNHFCARDQLGRPRRSDVVSSPGRGDLLASPRQPVRRRRGDRRHCAAQALPLAARSLAPGNQAMAGGSDLRGRGGGALAGRLGGDRLRRAAQLPDAPARSSAGRSPCELLADRSPWSQRQDGDGSDGRAVAGGDRRHLVGRARLRR